MNWGPGAQGGFENSLMMGMRIGENVNRSIMQGRQMREERDGRNALAAFVSNPNQQTAAAVAPYKPDLAYQYSKDERERTAKANLAGIAQQALAGDNQALGQLFTLDNDLWKRLDDRQKEGIKGSTGYMAQRALQIGRLPEDQRAAAWTASVQEAERGGMDIPAYMEAYSPNVIEGTIARAGIMEKYIQQFEPDFRVIPQGGYLEDVNPLTGGMPAQSQGVGQPQPQPQQPAGEVPTISPDQWQANVQAMGLPRAINWAASNGIAVPISGDSDYAQLPSGATFVGPDGLTRRKP